MFEKGVLCSLLVLSELSYFLSDDELEGPSPILKDPFLRGRSELSSISSLSDLDVIEGSEYLKFRMNLTLMNSTL